MPLFFIFKLYCGFVTLLATSNVDPPFSLPLLATSPVRSAPPVETVNLSLLVMVPLMVVGPVIVVPDCSIAIVLLLSTSPNNSSGVAKVIYCPSKEIEPVAVAVTLKLFIVASPYMIAVPVISVSALI